MTVLFSLLFVLPCFANEIDFSLYHTTDEVYAQVRSLASSSDLIRLTTVPLGEGEDMQLVSISDYTHKHGHTRDKIRVLINCGEHGRELITSEIALQFLHFFVKQHLFDRKSAQLFSSSSSVFSVKTIQFLLRNVEFFLIPLTSPWARIQVENGNYCNRKTKNFVDLNRNWDYLWQPTGSKQNDQYSGEKPFSEPESRAVRDIAVKLQPHMYINVHSGSRDLFTGWDHRQELVPNSEEVLRLLRHLSKNYVNCSVGGAGIGGGYVVFGGSMDYLYDYLKVNYSFTWEVAGGTGALSDCYRFFNPSRKADFKSTVESWVAALASSALFLLSDKLSLSHPFTELQNWLLDPVAFSTTTPPIQQASSRLSSNSASSAPLKQLLVLGGVEWDNIFTARVASEFTQEKIPLGVAVLPSLFAPLQYDFFFENTSPVLCYQDMSRKVQQVVVERRMLLEADLDAMLEKLQPSIILVLHSSATATEPSLAFESVSPAYEFMKPPKGFSLELSQDVSVSTIDLARIHFMPRDFIIHLTFSRPAVEQTPSSISTVLSSDGNSGRVCTFFDRNPAQTLTAAQLPDSGHYLTQLRDVLAWIDGLQPSLTFSAERTSKKRIIREVDFPASEDPSWMNLSFFFYALMVLAVIAFFVVRKRASRAKFHP